jgi:predicted nucleic acid-binding protein
MTRVFADTFFFLAVLNRRDPSHEAALRFYADANMHFVTTEWVLGEVANASSAPTMRAGFKRLFDLLERDARMRIIPASHDAFRRGLELYFNRPDKEWSFTDCASFAVMSEEGMEQALTGDHHFEQAGFRIVLGGRAS